MASRAGTSSPQFVLSSTSLSLSLTALSLAQLTLLQRERESPPLHLSLSSLSLVSLISLPASIDYIELVHRPPCVLAQHLGTRSGGQSRRLYSHDAHTPSVRPVVQGRVFDSTNSLIEKKPAFLFVCFLLCCREMVAPFVPREQAAPKATYHLPTAWTETFYCTPSLYWCLAVSVCV